MLLIIITLVYICGFLVSCWVWLKRIIENKHSWGLGDEGKGVIKNRQIVFIPTKFFFHFLVRLHFRIVKSQHQPDSYTYKLLVLHICNIWTQYNWECNERIGIFQNWWLFLLCWFQYYSEGEEKDKKEFIFIIIFLLGVFAEWHSDCPPADAHRPPASQHLLPLPLESSEAQCTAGLYIYYGHKQNLQSQWDLSSQMIWLEEVLNALQPFAPAWVLRESGIIFDFWLPPTYRPQQRHLWKSVVAI